MFSTMTAPLLQSYVGGAWTTPADDGQPVLDAATGDLICRVSSEGIDVAEALGFGRTVGGSALRGLTFHERAGLLKSLATHLNDQREVLYDLSARTGATRADSKFDIDGGIGVLFAYASKARRELPDLPYLVEGPVERLGRGGTFLGQHICVPSQGVAVQINAFNFPVWGPLEKLAPAFIAGVPSIIKPATQTAYLTARLVELIADSGILPEGSVQLVCGGARDLLDHLGEQDLVSFTGSASTAELLRAHPAITERAVRFNAEADSLNCSILGADVQHDSPLFALFIEQLVREMIVKAGQKCTAIRRVLVPEDLVDAVVAATTKKLGEIAVGNPRERDVGMGPLASLGQRDELRRALDQLTSSGTLVYGDGGLELIDADEAKGAFVSPALIVADPDRAAPHEVEPFGPASTVFSYRSVTQAVELAVPARGSLAGSVVTADTDLAKEVVLGLAPWHGRILVLNERNAGESTGHGSPLPALVHGGPGRAGGGEEMGGIRGVLHHMQRTAVQASPRMLTAITGRWTPGAGRRTGGVHPFRKNLAELRIGDTVVAGPRTVTMDDIDHFAEFTGDKFYAHTDAKAAAANPFFDGI